MAEQVVMSDEQFTQLLETLRLNTNTSQISNIPSPPIQSGNFINCASRFNGDGNSDVNAFIDAIEIYIDCIRISNDNAFRGLPMPLDSFAATWFRGVKSSINTWNEAVNLLRITFGPKKPPHFVYRKLFSREQDSKTHTNVFICKARSILAQLPENTLTETVQLDMVYELLKKIREKEPRDKIEMRTELLKEAPSVEEFFDQNITCEQRDTIKRPRCAYCKNLGHIKDECRKLAYKLSKPPEGVQQKITQVSSIQVVDKEKPSTPRVSQNLLQQTSQLTSSFSCYGCGQPGYIRTNCPN
ncbi:hypothetical protein NQ314_012490 [Rhamnusium bicolor]|uniref:CCHC-type domain-containing protein n=1 Tax=Rhamnusium bicolor TaxID=1586634 RepID=A0AAV8XBX0_9CUCU|nr:hypothetical protein NQ314_012490 [Rhamnusium bicolor]